MKFFGILTIYFKCALFFTVDELMTVLHDQRYGDSKDKYILKYLDLSHLNISWLPENIFEFFPTIEVLKLSNNPIRTMENITSAIKTLKKLEVCGVYEE